MGRGPSLEDRRGVTGHSPSQRQLWQILKPRSTAQSGVASFVLLGRDGEKVEASGCEPFPSWALACGLSSAPAPPALPEAARWAGREGPSAQEGARGGPPCPKAFTVLFPPSVHLQRIWTRLEKTKKRALQSPLLPPTLPRAPPSSWRKVSPGVEVGVRLPRVGGWCTAARGGIARRGRTSWLCVRKAAECGSS